MVAHRTTQLLCDRCGTSKDVLRRRISYPESSGRQLTFDACGDCAAEVPLSEWEKHKPRSPRRYDMVVTEAVVERAARKPGSRG